VFFDLQKKHPAQRLTFSLNEVHKICGFDKTLGFRLGYTVQALRETIKKRSIPFYVAQHFEEDTKFDNLQRVIESGKNSYPIISLSPDFLEEQGVVIDDNTVDHCVVVIEAAKDTVWFHDPYRPFGELVNRSREYKNRLPLVRMLEYWDKAEEPRWCLGIEHRGGPLERYGLEWENERRKRTKTKVEQQEA
jgi:hypothetical protein